jgi:hypothetical protein
MAEPLPSLLMAVLGPAPFYAKPLGAEPDLQLRAEVDAWMGQDKAKKELMLQALYGALPYAFMDEQAARAVGRLLARAVGGAEADPPPEEADIQALRRELREELRERFNKLRAAVP